MMKIISDLHIHSRFSRACSKQLDIPNLEKYARIKGLNLLGTGDFTHPLWLKELKDNLEEDDEGILRTKSGFNFLLSSELSNIYTQDGKGRRVHNVLLAPSFDVVDQINSELLKRGRLDYDGRPIFGFSCVELVEIMRSVSKDIEIIPSHIWTPWYSLFGSNSGFDRITDCFKDQTKHIHALETGLSSDPAMNWRLSQLDDYSLVSFSDSHSFWPWRIGREATVFDTDLSYKSILKALRTKEGLKETIEVEPSYGKYHIDGHRNCDVHLEPKESKKLNNICPKCNKPLTIGVLNRVEELADREDGFKPKDAKPFRNLIPLSEIIAETLGMKQVTSKKVMGVYDKLIKEFDSELNVLLNVPFDKLKSVVDESIANSIIMVREGDVNVTPGYDGVYGKAVFSKPVKKVQTSLSQF